MSKVIDTLFPFSLSVYPKASQINIMHQNKTENHRTEARVVKNQELSNSSGWVVLEPSYGNIHEIFAITDTIFFDLLVPPYSDEHGRSCRYFTPDLSAEQREAQKKAKAEYLKEEGPAKFEKGLQRKHGAESSSDDDLQSPTSLSPAFPPLSFLESAATVSLKETESEFQCQQLAYAGETIDLSILPPYQTC